MSRVFLVTLAMLCPMPPWNVNKTSLFQREHGCHIFFSFHWLWVCWFWGRRKILICRISPCSQRNRCTIWFWVWHPGFGSSSSTQLIKAPTIKSEDVKDKRVAFTCHKILFKIILNHSVLTFTFPFLCMEKRTARYSNQASGNEHLLVIKSRFFLFSNNSWITLCYTGLAIIRCNVFISLCSGTLLML